jgi:endonuclease YncB( thermonuclease family)
MMMFSIFVLLAAKILAVYPATVVKMEDGDTVKVSIPAFQNTPFYILSVRIHGIDTPESSKAHAKCPAEITAGKVASQYAKTLVKPGDHVTVGYMGVDKYGGRILGSITLDDGRDWATTLLSKGYANPYDGKTKADWCAILKKKK